MRKRALTSGTAAKPYARSARLAVSECRLSSLDFILLLFPTLSLLGTLDSTKNALASSSA